MADISFDSLAIIVAVEQVPYRDQNFKAVGINVSVALQEGIAAKMGLADVEKLLCPWLWTLKGVTLLVRNNTTATCQSVDATIIGDYTKVRSDNADFLAHIQARLRQRFNEAAAKGGVYWKPGLPDPGDTTRVNLEARPPWQVQIAEQFVLPAPITALLNLSCIAKFKLPAGITKFSCFAVPQFSVQLTAGPVEFAPVVPASPPDDCLGKSADPGVRTWPYQANGAVPTTAYLKAADPPADDPENLLECSTLLLKKDGLTDSDVDRADDWLARLGIRCADGFDLARAILESFRQVVATNDPARALFVGFVQFFLAALRDQSGLGYWPGPDQRSLLDLALTGWRKGNPQSSSPAIENPANTDSENSPAATPTPAEAVCDDASPTACADAEKANWPDLAKWIAMLESIGTASPHFRDALQTLKKASNAANTGSVPLPAIVDAMQVVYGELTKESFLGNLVLAQWETLRDAK